MTLSVIILTTSELTSRFLREYDIQIKLLIETKPIVYLPWEILHYKISSEKLEPEAGF